MLQDTLDYQSMAAGAKYYDLTVRLLDQGGSVFRDSKVVRINVTDVNEAPVATGYSADWMVNEYFTILLGKASVTDPDANPTFNGPFSYSMQNVSYSNTSGWISVSYGYSVSATATGCNFEIEPTYAHAKFEML